jgi:hypothetical protein
MRQYALMLRDLAALVFLAGCAVAALLILCTFGG